MKREILATIVITILVLRGLVSTLFDVKAHKIELSNLSSGYSELIDQDIIFDEEFDGSMSDRWQIQDNQGKYNRISTNMADNIELTDDDSLKLTTKVNSDNTITTPYMTIDTDDNGDSFNYGYYEAKIKFTNNNELPKGADTIPGTNILKPWGAFWMYPLEQAAGKGSEVDIVENTTADTAAGSLHELDNYAVIDKEHATSWFKGEDYNINPSHYHVYGVNIEPNEYEDAATYTFYIDGQEFARVSSSYPLGNQTIHLSMEIADTDYSEGNQVKSYPELADFKDESMIVDYVRVYQSVYNT